MSGRSDAAQRDALKMGGFHFRLAGRGAAFEAS